MITAIPLGFETKHQSMQTATQTDTRVSGHEISAELIRDLLPSLERFTLSMVANRADVEDIVADAVLVALERQHKLNSREALLSYLFTTVRNSIRRRHRRARWFGQSDEDPAEIILSHDLPADQQLDIAIIYECLDRLPFAMRETFVMFEISGLSLNEIHAIQGGSLSGVKTRLVRARESIRKALADKPQNSDENERTLS